MFTNPRIINELGGILVDYVDQEGNAYFDPDTYEHVAALDGVFGLVAPYEPPTEPPAPTRLYKSVFIQRMEPDEAVLLEAALAGEDPKLRLMFNAVEYFVSDDPLTAYLHWVVSLALGSEEEPNFDRADQLLAEDV